MKIQAKTLTSHLGTAAALAPIGSTRAGSYVRLRSAKSDDLGDILTVEGWGDAAYYRANLPASGKGLDAVLSADAIRLAVSCHAGELELSQKKGRLHMNSESRATNSLALADGPAPPAIERPPFSQVCPVSELQHLLRHLGPVASTDATRPHLCVIECDGHAARATDGYSASQGPAAIDATIPSLALKGLSAAIGGYNSVSVANTASRLIISNEHMLVSVPVERPRAFPVQALFEAIQPGQSTAEMDAADLIAALGQAITCARASSLASGQRLDSPVVSLIWEGGAFGVASTDGTAEVDVDAVAGGPDLDIVVNADFLQRGIQATGARSVTLHASDPTSPLLVVGDDVRSAIMPRLK